MFKVGDIVVYPAHGVAEVESVEDREISGHTTEFFILKVMDSQMTVMVPVNNVENVGIRQLLDAEGIEKVMDILKERS
ncbi:MAG: CarD family transcriptional regulator, partial [Desulfomonilia bacterium]|nr:CarD family transcriptional regulator [Desulfomonilia bacterium]